MNELERCRPWIEAALEHSGGTHTFDDVVDLIVQGRAQLWPGPRGCAVTEIVVYPRKKLLHIFLAGGDLTQLLDMYASAEAWGLAQGCAGMSLSGRKGWERVMGPHGWKTTSVQLSKDF